MEGKIYAAITGVMKDIGAVGKDSFNEQQRFKFRGIDAVMNALYPALVKNKVFVVPEILEQTREERESSRGGRLIYSICKIKYTFYAEDGSSISAVTIGEGMDSGDKATNKAMAIALKYAFFQVFCIPTEEMADPDAESHEIASERPKTLHERAQERREPIGMVKAKALADRCQKMNVNVEALCKRYSVEKLSDLTEDQHKKIADMLNKAEGQAADMARA